VAKIRDAKGRRDGKSGYARLVGDQQLGDLLSKVQAAVISAGTELEKLIAEHADTGASLDEILDGKIKNGIFLIPKQAVKKSRLAAQFEADLLIFEITEAKRHCYIVELKDGDSFDTKKSSGEKTNMERFQDHISKLISFTTSIHFCCFNQDSREEIVRGFKNKIKTEEAMTGQELCDILRINYNAINAQRQADQKDNLEFFVGELLKIESVQKHIKK
jgi:hypothetical protein